MVAHMYVEKSFEHVLYNKEEKLWCNIVNVSPSLITWFLNPPILYYILFFQTLKTGLFNNEYGQESLITSITLIHLINNKYVVHFKTFLLHLPTIFN